MTPVTQPLGKAFVLSNIKNIIMDKSKRLFQAARYSCFDAPVQVLKTEK